MSEKAGLAGRLAAAFINAKITPVLIILALSIGLFATAITPREEEPQIIVPMVDIFVSAPGATPAEIEKQVTEPMEKLLAEIPGVEYIYSQAMPGQNLTIVRFLVGENAEDSLTKLYTKLMANFDRIPPGVSQPLIKLRSIDDVPVLALTLWSKTGHWASNDLRRQAVELAETIKQDSDVAEVKITGGEPREFRVDIDLTAMAARGLTLDSLSQAINNSNQSSQTLFPVAGQVWSLQAGNFITTIDEAKQVVVAVYQDRPVLLGDIAKISEGTADAKQYVLFNSGLSHNTRNIANTVGNVPAVTISVAKKTGSNATALSERLLANLKISEQKLLPRDVEVSISRNYGETANDKSNELLEHMLIATLSVVVLMAVALGKREAVVVAVAVPVTLALTLMINYMLGYTLNRVTLFALIFSIGILVDDAIVVVENIHRHFVLYGVSRQNAINAVNEVGNPTILATFTVIASLLPMAFVSGLMGPYMRPIPVGASAAMLFSLLVAFIISPWLAWRLLGKKQHKEVSLSDKKAATDKWGQLYERIIGFLLYHKKRRRQALLAVLVLLLITCALVPLKLVMVKMLPFDNKSEFQVIIDMPTGTGLERTTALATELGNYLKTVPEASDYQIYAGTSSPYNFNGLVRHYFLRNQAWQADIQVNLASKGERSRSSHEIAKSVRPYLEKIAASYSGKIKVAEVPPGPPVLSTLVAEIYGPNLPEQRKLAAAVKEVFADTPGVVDVDWYVEDDQPQLLLQVDRQKAAQNGIAVKTVAQTINNILSGSKVTLVHSNNEREPEFITLRIPYAEQAQIATLLRSIPISALDGHIVALAELVQVSYGIENKTIYHKNLRRVTYVVGDMAGEAESPVYGILDMMPQVEKIATPMGESLPQYSAIQPPNPWQYAMKWDGEWHVTYEVFRDMGIAFAIVMALIYILVLVWFGDFVLPILIMAPIPLTLIGILPGHWLFGAFFTATSMIGFIALSGIIVRNSILLVDFAENEARAGVAYDLALIKAGAVRLRPILLTAAAVVVGSIVMLFDPIFQGLAIAMMFGAVVATILTLLVIPLLCWELSLWRTPQQTVNN